jgi:hypothetical protein
MTHVATLVRRRLNGSFSVDEWGLDRDAVEFAEPFARARWAVSADATRCPCPDGAALVVVNRRFALTELLVTAMALRGLWHRPVRFAGIPDIAPIGPALRRVGGVLSRPDEVGGLLRAGHLVLVPCSAMPRRPQRAGTVDPELVSAAVHTNAPVVPVAAIGREWGRAWRVHTGTPLPPARSTSPLAVVEHADAARAAVQELLDELEPPRWLL